MSFKIRHLACVSLVILGGCKAAAGSELKSELPPQPPIWIVSDADSEITLYPTIHILPAEVEWQSEELLRRIAGAEEVWFEIMPGSGTDPALQQKMFQLGLAPGTSLSTHLTENEVAALKAATAPMQLPFEVVDMMRPWMANMMVGAGALVESGFDPNSGVEKQLEPMAKGKKIRALETAEGQMQMLASLPEDTQLEMLREGLSELDEMTEMMRALVNDWSVGDVKDMEADLIMEMKTETPAAYDILITQRNKNWTDQIETEMKGSGTDFIAVGAGHLIGDDSVPAMLKARGYTVERL